jgi:hypothetical protein
LESLESSIGISKSSPSLDCILHTSGSAGADMLLRGPSSTSERNQKRQRAKVVETLATQRIDIGEITRDHERHLHMLADMQDKNKTKSPHPRSCNATTW